MSQDMDGFERVDEREFTEQEKTEKTDKFPCPGCGANMKFNPDTQTLTCEYCSRSIEIASEDTEIEEHDFFTADDSADGNWGQETRVIKCERCGAKTVLDVYSAAASCAFCGSPHVVKIDESAGIPPESLIPFSVSADKALKLFGKWIKGRFFAPGDVKRDCRSHKLTGVYVPFWTYDADTWSAYTGEAGTYYYVTRTHWVTRNGKRTMVTTRERRIRWRPAAGVYTEYFDDIPVNASVNIEAQLMAKLQPFCMDRLVRYKPEYLSGFIAERYGIGLREGWESAREVIKKRIYNGVVRQINADTVRNIRINTRYRSIKYKHLLLPVWISSFTYKNKVYRYMVNGQTGEVQGRAPVSPWKVASVVLVVAAIAAVAYFAIKTYKPF
jgi:ribosomal protein L37E